MCRLDFSVSGRRPDAWRSADVQAAGLEEAGGGDLVEPRDGAGVQVLPQLAAAGQLLRRRGTRRGHVVRRRAVPAREQGLVVGQPEATRLIAMQ